MKPLKLRCICRPNEYDLPKILVENIRAKLRIGNTYFANNDGPLSQQQLDAGWEASWTLQHFDLPFTLSKKHDGINKKGRNYYVAAGIPGLWFTDRMHNLELRDTRRNSDWDKLQDKRVVRRMHRQMAKGFAGATDLHSARNHKR